MRRRILAICSALIVLALSAASRANLVVDGLETARHERFAGGGSLFIGSAAVTGGAALDFSGVARGTNGYWATMISTTHFISAAHAHATGTVVFHHDNDPSGLSSIRTVTGGGRIGGTDIWVGTLNAPVDPHLVAIYSIALPGDYTDEPFYQVGRGTKFGTDNTSGFRVGRNLVSDVYEDVELGSAVTDSLVYFDDSAAGDLTGADEESDDHIPDETFLQSGDSGGPSFWISGMGEMLLLGTHSFITEPDPDDPDSPFNDRRASGDAYLPAYRGQILAAVPEASQGLAFSALVLLLGLVGAIKRRSGGQ
ncbi:hypothetical protein [Adhaeretor mobilis]|uniref:Peptidase S1 domain-containing protein n=1 Tax=Adhaeretor mobilis TaxID=1930276 RepID=A0A517MQ08_9BACT|nr:hypothetical protein [Adhaeretor mobilis]QDS96976.1 hypothetical protein HG15A2_02350 [Adhaeretor mobilis]